MFDINKLLKENEEQWVKIDKAVDNIRKSNPEQLPAANAHLLLLLVEMIRPMGMKEAEKEMLKFFGLSK